MINTIRNIFNKVLKRIELSKINFLNHKFKKFIIKYEEYKDIIKVYNSNGDYKIVDNTVPNKVKIMEIIKDHQKLIDKEIEYYDNNKDDYKIIIISSSLFLIILGCTFVFSFFVGSYILFLLTFLSFTTSLVLFLLYTYKTLLFREEVKRLKNIKNNNMILDDNEIIDIFKDTVKYIKNTFYDFLLKIISIKDNIRIKLSKI